MDPRRARAKGAETEQWWVDFLKEWGVVNAERRHLSGAYDKGDVVGWNAQDGSWSVCQEVKSGATLAIPKWMKELEAEMFNAKSETGALIIRPKGKPKPKDWWCVLPAEVYMELMKKAGYL